MGEQTLSPEQHQAAVDFNARREQDARDWNNHAAESASSSVITESNGHAVLSESALNDAASSWHAPENSTPDNVTDIESHPNFHRVETPGATPETDSAAAEHQDSVQEVGEVVAAESLTKFEAAKQTFELMEKLASGPEAIQANTIDAVDLIIKLSENPKFESDKEALSSVLLAQLQAEGQSVDLESAKAYMAALGKISEHYAGHDQWQEVVESKLTSILVAASKHFGTPKGSTQTHAQPVAGQPANALINSAELAQPQAATEKVVDQQTEAVADASGSPIKTAVETAPAQDEPDATTETPAANEAENERLQAEIDAEQEKYRELKVEISSAWRNLPPNAQNSLELSRLPTKAGFLDVDAFTAQLEQRMDNSNFRANTEFSGLNGEGLEVELARKKRINEELEKLHNTIERGRLNSAEVIQGVAEADKIKTKHAENLEKMQSKLNKHLAGKPWLRDLVKFDPHVQRNPYFSKYGHNELGV